MAFAPAALPLLAAAAPAAGAALGLGAGATAAIGAGLGMAGAGLGAIGQISQGQAQAAQARYEAQVAENNQQIAAYNAARSTAAGEQRTYDIGLRERAKYGAIAPAYGAAGLDVSVGSPRDVRQSQRVLGEQAEQTTKEDAALQAYGYRAAGVSYGAQAQLERAAAPMDVTAGYLGAGGTLLSSASNIGFKWGGLGNTPASSSTMPVWAQPYI